MGNKAINILLKGQSNILQFGAMVCLTCGQF